MSPFFLIFFSILIAILTVGNFSSFALIKKALNLQVRKKDVLYALLFSFVAVIVMFIFREIWFDGVRLLYLYIGALNFFGFAGIFYYLFTIIVRVFKKDLLQHRKYIARVFLFFGLFFTLFATYNFFSEIEVENYVLESDKVTQEYNFVQVNDIQYGTVTKEYIAKVVQKINKQNPDFVVFVGDLVDFEGYQESDFDVLAEINAPIYFERGNHEFYHFPEKILSYLQKISNVKLLTNKKDSFGEIDITGIDYEQVEGLYENALSKIELDESRYNILIYHEPKNVEYSIDYGFDLLLYGHTHAGQIWPFTWVVDYMYQYGDGFFTVGDAVVHTSDGAALWGPRMRLGSQNEIVVFTITPEL